MRINIYAEGFQLTSQLRAFVEGRLLSALGLFRDRIQSAHVHVRATNDRTVRDITSCDVAVNLYPSGEVRARAQKPRMEESINQAVNEIRAMIENAVSQPQPASAPSHVVKEAIRRGAFEVVLDSNRISQHQREMLERPENYLRPVMVREYWRPPGVEHGERPEEVEAALATIR